MRRHPEHDLPIWMVSNLYPYMVTVAGIIFTALFNYFTIISDIRDIKKDLAYMKETQNEYFERNKEVQIRLGTAEVDIARCCSNITNSYK